MSPIQNAHCVRKQNKKIFNYFLTETVATWATLNAPDALNQAKLFWTNLFLINIRYKILPMQAQKTVQNLHFYLCFDFPGLVEHTEIFVAFWG